MFKWLRRYFSRAEVTPLFYSYPTNSGVSVNSESAWRVVAAHAAVKVIAESLAQIPLILYRINGRTKERAIDHPLYSLLHDSPNRFQTAFDFRQLLAAHSALRGNGYARIVRSQSEGVIELLPLHPDNVRVGWKDDRQRDIVYSICDPDTREYKPVPAGSVLHIKNVSKDGLLGMSPIEEAREALGLAIAAERHGANTFGNGARPAGVLIHPQKLDAETATALREKWDETYGGKNSGKTAILQNGMSFQAVSLTNEDAQFLETRKFQRNEIAALFRVPPHMIGDLERATFSNIEQQSLEFVQYTLGPWMARIEQAINKSLLTPEERKTYRAEFLAEGLLRGDYKTRMEGYKIAILHGIMSPNEVRSLENLNPRKGGDEFIMQLNTAKDSKENG